MTFYYNLAIIFSEIILLMMLLVILNRIVWILFQQVYAVPSLKQYYLRTKTIQRNFTGVLLLLGVAHYQKWANRGYC